ncbi:hypothetical protein TNCV_2035031 [Trichonephila clavipes]|nr:hypothetical protein TNCV_2035031 [Trichonephila clavipes]
MEDHKGTLTSKNEAICNTALSNNDNSKSSFVKLHDIRLPAGPALAVSPLRAKRTGLSVCFPFCSRNASSPSVVHLISPLFALPFNASVVAAVAEWYRYRTVACLLYIAKSISDARDSSLGAVRHLSGGSVHDDLWGAEEVTSSR